MRLCIFLAIGFLVSCAGSSSDDRKDGFSNTAKNPEDSLFQDVMDLHDEAMGKSRKLEGYRNQINSKIDSLKKVKSPAKESVVKKYSDLVSELQQAENNMDLWMNQFSIDTLQDDPKRRIEYLESEKSKVSVVRDEILTAASKADSALKK